MCFDFLLVVDLLCGKASSFACMYSFSLFLLMFLVLYFYNVVVEFVHCIMVMSRYVAIIELVAVWLELLEQLINDHDLTELGMYITELGAWTSPPLIQRAFVGTLRATAFALFYSSQLERFVPL